MTGSRPCGVRLATTSQHLAARRVGTAAFSTVLSPTRTSSSRSGFFLRFSLFGILLGILAVVLAGCGPSTYDSVLSLGVVPAGLRRGEMSGPSESNDEPRNKLPSVVDAVCPAQHFADNVTGHINGRSARNNRDVYRTSYFLGPIS